MNQENNSSNEAKAKAEVWAAADWLIQQNPEYEAEIKQKANEYLEKRLWEKISSS